MIRKPRIFVGSSTEGSSIDRLVRSIIENFQVDVTGWREVFHAGDHPLDVLLNLACSVDGALLIVTPDEQTFSRGQEHTAPRGNILLEFGLFISQLGKHRAAIVHAVSSEEYPAQLPSDLYGITTIPFEPDRRGNNEQRLKDFVDRVREESVVIHPATAELQLLLRKTLCNVPPAWHIDLERYLLQSMREAIHLAARGQVVLSPGQYYGAIFTEMDAASDKTDIVAVSTLSSAFWAEDRDQQHYLKKNKEAVRRGVKIRRLFVVPDSQWEDLAPILRMQIVTGIKVRRAAQRIAADLALEDMVMFTDTGSGECRVFIADPSFDNSRRIRRARLLLDAHERQHLLRALFEQAWATAPDVTLRDLDQVSGEIDSDVEPAKSMKSFGLEEAVVTCEEAAAAKCIPLENELKTLVLATSRGYVALNLPGASLADFRAVKTALEVEQACLAPPDELEALGLSPGTVCAVKRPVWGMPFLISRRLLQLPFVSTNDGTLRGFYKFDPALLLEARSVMLGDFERRGPQMQEEVG
jgi:prolyl-tRNA editing enzyme YbaK/EbsC (Cys-tRNA(Pro) deacylase)